MDQLGRSFAPPRLTARRIQCHLLHPHRPTVLLIMGQLVVKRKLLYLSVAIHEFFEFEPIYSSSFSLGPAAVGLIRIARRD